MSGCDGCSDLGQCCRYVELPLARVLTQDEASWVKLHPGLSLILDVRADRVQQTIRIETRCRALAHDGMCMLYDRPERPEMCSVWPDDPINQAPPGCVFLPMAVGQPAGA